jgi:hypothetical protein
MVHQVDAGNVVKRNEQEFLSGIGDQRGDLIADSMKQIAQGRQQAADMALTSRQTAAITAAQAAADRAANAAVTGHSAVTNNYYGAPAPPPRQPVRNALIPNTQRYNPAAGGIRAGEEGIPVIPRQRRY